MRNFRFVAGFLMTVFMTFTAWAGQPRLLVSVQDFQSDSKNLTTQICEKLKLLQTNAYPMSVVCTYVSSFDLANEKIQELRASSDFQFHVEITRLAGGDKLDIRTYNLKPFDSQDFVKVGNLYTGTEDELILSATNHIQQVGGYYNNQFLIRQQIVSKLVYFSTHVTIDPDKKIRDRKTGLVLTWEQAYKILTYESAEHERVGRAMIELSAMYGFASFIYHRNLVVNQTDFDYDSLNKKIKDTLWGTSGWTFDTNKELYNTGHAVAGQLYFQTGRVNGFSALKSFAIAWTASLIWEVIGERKEKASINDQIVTPVGGAILGEAGFQIAHAIRKRSNSVLAKTFAFLLDPMSPTNKMIDRLTGDRKKFLSDISDDQYASMETFIARSLDDSRSTTLGYHADVINIPGYGKEGEVSGVIVDTVSAEMVAEITKNRLSNQEIKWISSVAWIAYHDKSIRNQNGYEATFAASSEFEYDKRQRPTDDFNLTVHMIGPQARVEGYINGFKIQANVAIYADFAMMTSLALAEYDKANPNQRIGLQNIIREENYYYGLGVTDKIRLALSKSNWTAFIEKRNSHLSSINGHDRYQETVTKDLRFKDTKNSTTAGISVELTKNTRLTVKQERLNRNSQIEGGYLGKYSIKRNWIQVDYKW